LRREILAANFEILQSRVLLANFRGEKFVVEPAAAKICRRARAKAKLGRERL